MSPTPLVFGDTTIYSLLILLGAILYIYARYFYEPRNVRLARKEREERERFKGMNT